MIRRIHKWAALLSLPIGVYAGYTFLYFAWLTATPLTKEGLSRAQYDAYFWFAILAICFLIISSFVVAMVLRKNKKIKTRPN